MFTCKVIAAYVRWKPEHREESKTSPEAVHTAPDRLQVIFLAKHVARRLEIDNHVRLFFEHLYILGELACLFRFRFEEGHNSMLHFIKSLRVQFLALALMRNI